MSEQDRSRLYDWWCEHADAPLAEYAMSCLSPVPLPELATKADFTRLEAGTKADFTRLEAGTKADFMRLEAGTKADFMRLEAATKADFMRLETKFDRLVDARETDRENSRIQFRWLIGLGATGFGVLLATMFALAAIS